MLLVTGATGFIGRGVCEEAARRGLPIVAAVRRPVGSALGLASRVVGDIGHDTDWSAALDGVSTVVHIAGAAHIPVRDAASEAAVWETNVEGTDRLARAAAASGVQRLVFLSTVKVHGERTTGAPFREDDVCAPRDAYARSKLEAERRARHAAARSGMTVTVLRTPLVYGPGVRANFLGLLRLVDRGI